MDRLEEIKARYANAYGRDEAYSERFYAANADVTWLVAEVERLRADLTFIAEMYSDD